MLRRAYRDHLRRRLGAARFVFLDGAPATIRERLEARHGHFFKADLLDSQFATLEPPMTEEGAVQIVIAESVEEIVGPAVAALSTPPKSAAGG